MEINRYKFLNLFKMLRVSACSQNCNTTSCDNDYFILYGLGVLLWYYFIGDWSKNSLELPTVADDDKFAEKRTYKPYPGQSNDREDELIRPMKIKPVVKPADLRRNKEPPIKETKPLVPKPTKPSKEPEEPPIKEIWSSAQKPVVPPKNPEEPPIQETKPLVPKPTKRPKKPEEPPIKEIRSLAQKRVVPPKNPEEPPIKKTKLLAQKPTKPRKKSEEPPIKETRPSAQKPVKKQTIKETKSPLVQKPTYPSKEPKEPPVKKTKPPMQKPVDPIKKPEESPETEIEKPLQKQKGKETMELKKNAVEIPFQGDYCKRCNQRCCCCCFK